MAYVTRASGTRALLEPVDGLALGVPRVIATPYPNGATITMLMVTITATAPAAADTGGAEIQMNGVPIASFLMTGSAAHLITGAQDSTLVAFLLPNCVYEVVSLATATGTAVITAWTEVTLF